MKPPTAPSGALKLKDAAQYLGGVSTITVCRLIKRGLIKPNLALRLLLTPIKELDRFASGKDRAVDSARDKLEAAPGVALDHSVGLNKLQHSLMRLQQF